MSIFPKSEQLTLTSETDTSSFVSLLKRGLHYSQQGQYSEGATFFRLAREQLIAEQHTLSALLDQLARSYTNYAQAQELLQEANNHFVKADVEHLTNLATLAKLLPLLNEATRPPAQHDAVKISQSHQLPPCEEEGTTLPALYFVCFGHFEVRRNGQPLLLCPNRKGQATLRYLVAHAEHCASIDNLINALWTEDAIGNARHKLQVAISALRCSLNRGCESNQGGGYILHHDQVYLLNPAVSIRSDVDDFLAAYQAGQLTHGSTMATQYEKACQLYTGPFLTEDLYADWSFMQREQLSLIYLTMCGSLAEYYLERESYGDTIQWARAISKENPCDEGAYRYLMRAYALSNRRNEALQQYKRCQSLLSKELNIQPSSETVNLFYAILSGEYPPQRGKKIEPR